MYSWVAYVMYIYIYIYTDYPCPDESNFEDNDDDDDDEDEDGSDDSDFAVKKPAKAPKSPKAKPKRVCRALKSPSYVFVSPLAAHSEPIVSGNLYIHMFTVR